MLGGMETKLDVGAAGGEREVGQQGEWGQRGGWVRMGRKFFYSMFFIFCSVCFT
jgi:hypothetical protein